VNRDASHIGKGVWDEEIFTGFFGVQYSVVCPLVGGSSVQSEHGLWGSLEPNRMATMFPKQEGGKANY
jgi:hypothetical protein